MPISKQELADRLTPARTVVFLGAGSAVPSGAPTGPELARQLCDTLARGEAVSEQLMEATSILEYRYGRDRLVGAIRTILKPLRPAGGLLALPEFSWHSIYTTNFDQLIESSYRRSDKPLVPIKSDFDYGRAEASEGTPLFKLHGCISQDLVDGHRARLVLTERDYEEYESYREILYRRLGHDLVTRDILVIGHSLGDPHLREAMNEAGRIHQKLSSSGRLYCLIYKEDPDRAALLERRGFNVCFAGIDELFHLLSSAKPIASVPLPEASAPGQLPLRLRVPTVEVAHAQDLEPDAPKLFNGAPATYADIAAGLTFRRSAENLLLDAIVKENKRFVTIIGVAGVGKTTLARRLLSDFSANGRLCYEHRSDFPLKSGEWLEVEKALAGRSETGILLIDECSDTLRQVNILAEALGKMEEPALRLVLTANSTLWHPRSKAPALFSQGVIERLSALSEEEIEQLINLTDNQRAIRELVDPGFHRSSRLERVRQLRSRCSADMYVCLKNIFATDALDTILLREYGDLRVELQDVYRHVAALEAAGARVHRQLVIRLLSIAPNKIRALLELLDGLIEEYDISYSEGLFGWCTRHHVISETIAKYKFADQDELYSLLERTIAELNPTIWIELRTLRDLCNIEFGIGRLSDPRRRVALYNQLIRLAPGERVPRHRLISTLLYDGQMDAADAAIRSAEADIGEDSPIRRYKVKSALMRAEATEGLLEEDRLAMIQEAKRLALRAVERSPADKYSYISYGDVGLALAERNGDCSVLDDSIHRTREAADSLLDPQLQDALRHLERQRRRFPPV